MSFVVNNGVRIHYEVEGNGPPLVLQHGFSFNLEHWYLAGIVRELERERRLILIDARGHGRSDKPHNAASYSNSNHVSDILAVLGTLGIDRTDYWGYSMGGWFGFGLATTFPERLRSIVITGQQPYGRTVGPGMPDGRDRRRFMEIFFKRIGVSFDDESPREQARFLENDCQALRIAMTDRPSMEADLHRMTMPCLLMAGERDPAFEGAERSVAAIPDCTWIHLKGFDHIETFDRADVLVPHVRRFLQEVEGR
jgi:pimeloyl-ACP methyl ester carboxylesterase